MRRFLAVAVLTIALTGTSACAGLTDETAGPAASSAAPAPSPSHNTKDVCAEFEKVFEGEALKGLGTAVGGVLLARTTKKAAAIKTAETAVQTELTALSASITKIGDSATDPKVKAAFTASAAAVDSTASDLAFLQSMKTADDLEATLTPELTSWALPLATICDLS